MSVTDGASKVVGELKNLTTAVKDLNRSLERRDRRESMRQHPSNGSNVQGVDLSVLKIIPVTFDSLLDPVHGQAILRAAQNGQVRIEVTFYVPEGDAQTLGINELLISAVTPL